MTQPDLDDDDDSGGERPLYIKEDDDDEPIKEDVSMDSTDGNDTRLSDLHNTTIKTEEDSEEDKPLVNFILFTNWTKKMSFDFFYLIYKLSN